MSKLEEQETKNDFKDYGILHPAFSHLWRILIGDKTILTVQSLRCELDIKNCTFELTVEQSTTRAQEMLDAIRDLAPPGSHDFEIQLFDGNEGILGAVRGRATMTSHRFVLDYAGIGVAVHELTFTYKPAA